MTQPPQHLVDHALQIANLSPCRSKRGVVLWEQSSGSYRGHGFNAPPSLLPCPGREVCAGTCGQRAVHAEVRAVMDAISYRTRGSGIDHTDGAAYDLLHVELNAPPVVDPGSQRFADLMFTRFVQPVDPVVACDGPSCGPCAALIADVGFIAGVWLFEQSSGWAAWRRYTAEEFYAATIQRLARAKLPISVGGVVKE